MLGDRDNNSIQSVTRAFDVLRALTRVPRGCSAIELAAQTGLDRTTVHRLLRTLVFTGAVDVANGSYYLGPTCTMLECGRQEATRLREVALPFAVDLQRSMIQDRPAIVSISSFARQEAIIVDRIWTPTVPLNIIVGIGWRFPIDAAVSGRAMLSTMEDEEIVALLGGMRHEQISERLKAIRQRDGMEFGSDEQHQGLSTMAFPVLGRQGGAVGSLVIAGLGMSEELSLDSPLAQNLRRSAEAVTRSLQNS